MSATFSTDAASSPVTNEYVAVSTAPTTRRTSEGAVLSLAGYGAARPVSREDGVDANRLGTLNHWPLR
ncbi:MAG: hypothetical protein QOE74_4982, partial [Mycobacterium sp.]|nr:hypothetical protein [Mycobacterium sp.]